MFNRSCLVGICLFPKKRRNLLSALVIAGFSQRCGEEGRCPQEFGHARVPSAHSTSSVLILWDLRLIFFVLVEKKIHSKQTESTTLIQMCLPWHVMNLIECA